jgi:Tol biopolymer transport system component
MKRVLFVVALLVAGTVALAGSAIAATTALQAYPGKNGLIAFVRSNQIYTISSSGSGLKKLTTSAKNYNPVWNPAGTEIAYEHEHPAGVRNIWVMNANGSSKRQWTNTGTTFGSPAWSPNGKTLLFTNGGQWGTLETTSATRPLQSRTTLYGRNRNWHPTVHTVLQGDNPSWTSGRIAFTGDNQYGTASECQPPEGSSTFDETCIEVYNTSSHNFYYANSQFGDLTANCGSNGGNATFTALDWPRWNPAGSDLLFQYQQETGETCSGLPWYAATTANSQLATQPGDQKPDYSPDGNYIVLDNTPPGKLVNVIIESSTGTNRRTLTQGYEPNWQPLN